MRSVTASEAKQSIASVIEAAAFEPIVIRKQKRDVAIVLSMREYERLVRANVTEFQRYCDTVGQAATARGLTEEKLAALLLADE